MHEVSVFRIKDFRHIFSYIILEDEKYSRDFLQRRKVQD